MPALSLILLLPFPSAALPPAAAWRGPPAAANIASDDRRESLEDLLRRLRAGRADARVVITAKIEELLIALKALGPRPREGNWEPIQDAFIALGPEGAPLFVPHLDPGEDPTTSGSFRAEVLSEALRRLPTPATTGPLLHLARTGSTAGRMLALRSLGATREKEIVSREVAAIFHSGKGSVRRAALTTLATIGGTENDNLLARSLADPEKSVVTLALLALAASGNEVLEPRVLDLVRSHRVAAEHVREIIAYYRAVPHLARDERILELVRLAADVDLSAYRRVDLLEVLPEFDPKLDSDLKKALAPLSESAVGSVREAALVCRTLLGDRRAGRDLLEPYKRQVDRNPGESRPLLERAAIQARIEEYGDAIADYRKALSSDDFYRRDSGETKVELARCFCLLGKLKDASKWLSDASISLKRLAQLAEDPDFAELKGDRRYGKVLQVR